jgi:hypothetical protein
LNHPAPGARRCHGLTGATPETGHAEVAIVPGSHGGFNGIDELNDRIAAFIEAQAAGKQAVQPAQPPATKR